MGDIIIAIELIIFIILVIYCDIRFKKIYNSITVPFGLIGIMTNTALMGWRGLYFSIFGLIIGFALMLLPFFLGWVGGGDVKLLGASGALIGCNNIFYGTLWGIIFSGLAALCYILIKKKLKDFAIHIKFLLFHCEISNLNKNISMTDKIPIGIYLGLGILVNWLYFTFYK